MGVLSGNPGGCVAGMAAISRSRRGFRVFPVRFDAVLLLLSLIGGAWLTAVALRSPTQRWVEWIALVPVFTALRVFTPLRAGGCGLLWGACLYAFMIGNPLRSPDFDPLAALAVVTLPGAYAFLGAALTRWIGFSPFVLGVAWAAVEIALAPLGLSLGLAATNAAGGGVLAWMGHVLGFALVAVVVGYVNAMLVSVLGCVRITVSRFSRVTASSDRTGLLPLRTLTFPSRFALQPSRPRAPPLWT